MITVFWQLIGYQNSMKTEILSDPLAVGSVLNQAADRDGSDVAGRRDGLRQGETDVD